MPCPTIVKGKEFNVYMQLFMEKLKDVWEHRNIGYDHSMLVGKRCFTLRVGVMTPIGDYKPVWE